MAGVNRSRSPEPEEAVSVAESDDAPGRQAQGTDRRRRSSSNRAPDRTPAGRQFLFIDASTDRGTLNEAVRVHVMRESHRHRRETRGSQSQNRGFRRVAQDDMVILDLRSTSRSTSTPPLTQTAPEEAPDIRVARTAIDWPTVMRAGTAEYTTGSSQELYRLAEDLRSVRLLQPDVLHLCRGDLLALSAYLALAALQFTANEDRLANVASDQFEARALELLRQRITQHSRMHTNTTIVAVLLLSQLEQHKNNHESTLFHRNALHRIVDARGGLTILQEQNPELVGILSDNGFADRVE